MFKFCTEKNLHTCLQQFRNTDKITLLLSNQNRRPTYLSAGSSFFTVNNYFSKPRLLWDIYASKPHVQQQLCQSNHT